MTSRESHRLGALVLLGRETTFSIDGGDFVTFMFDTTLRSGILSSAPILVSAPTDTSLADLALYCAYFDNYRVETVPEPGIFILPGTGFIAIGWRLQHGN